MINQLVEYAFASQLKSTSAKKLMADLQSVDRSHEFASEKFKMRGDEGAFNVYAIHVLSNIRNKITVDFDTPTLDGLMADIPVYPEIPTGQMQRVLPYGVLKFPEPFPVKFIIFYDRPWIMVQLNNSGLLSSIPYAWARGRATGSDVDWKDVSEHLKSVEPNEYQISALMRNGQRYLITAPRESLDATAGFPLEHFKGGHLCYCLFMAAFNHMLGSAPRAYLYKNRSETKAGHLKEKINESVRIEFSSRIKLNPPSAPIAVYPPRIGSDPEPRVKHWVREHYCNQPCGPGRRLRKRVLRKSHQRGSLEIEHNQGYVTEK